MALSVGRVFGLLELEDKFSAAIHSAAQQMSSFGDKAEKMGARVSQLGDRMSMSLTLPIVAIGGGALKAAIDFESSFAGVRKTVDATSEQFQQMEVDIRNMAKEMPLSVNEINRVAEAAGALGIERDSILGFTETMVKLGATTNLSADEAATAMARFTNIMQEPRANVDKLGAALVDLGNKGASTEREIVDMALRLAGAGKTVGLSSAQVLGMANALSSLGIEAEMGGSAMSKAMINMASAVSQGGGALKQIAEVAMPGVENAAQRFAEVFRKDASQAVGLFIQGLGNIKTSGGDLLGTLASLDINETRLRDTMLRVANAGDIVTQSMKTGEEAFSSAGNALETEYQKRLDTTASKLEIFKNRVYDVGITLGDRLIPALEKVFNAALPLIGLVEKLIIGFSKLPEPVQTFAIGLAGIVALAGPILSWGGRMIGMFGSIGAAVGLGGAGTAGAAGAGAAGAVASFSAILAGLAVPAALAGIVWGVMQVEKAVRDANKALSEGRFWEHVTSRQETWLSRATGMYVAPKTAAPQAAPMTGPTAPPKTGPVAGAPPTTGVNVGAGTGKTFAAEMRDAQKEIQSLKTAVSKDLTSAILSGAYSFEELKGKTTLSEAALRMFQDRVEKSAASQKKHTEEVRKASEKFKEIMADYHTMQREGIFAPISNVPGIDLDIAMPTGGFTEQHWVDYAKMMRESRDRAIIDQFSGQLPGKVFEIQMPPIPPTFWQKSFGSAENFGGGLASAIMGALQGGGSLFNSIGGFIGQNITTGLAKHLTTGLTPMLTGVLGGAVNAVLPGLGALLGPITEKIFGAFTGLFKREGRDLVKEFASGHGGFDTLREEMLVLEGGGEDLWKALTQGSHQNNPQAAQQAIDAVNQAFAEHTRQQSAAQEAIEDTAVETGHLADGLVNAKEMARELGTAGPEAMEKLVNALEQIVLTTEKMISTMETFIDRIGGAKSSVSDLVRSLPSDGALHADQRERSSSVTVKFGARELAREVVPYIAEELELQGV